MLCCDAVDTRSGVVWYSGVQCGGGGGCVVRCVVRWWYKKVVVSGKRSDIRVPVNTHHSIYTTPPPSQEIYTE